MFIEIRQIDDGSSVRLLDNNSDLLPVFLGKPINILSEGQWECVWEITVRNVHKMNRALYLLINGRSRIVEPFHTDLV